MPTRFHAALATTVVLALARPTWPQTSTSDATSTTTQDSQATPPRVEISVDVVPNRREIADEQIKQQEQQRVLGVFPNFRVSYDPNAVPLDSRQKFHLSWKSLVDPVSFAGTGIAAGIQYARGDFSGFGGGADGYAKRYAALYATRVTSTMIGNVALPALFKQDPRYFYKGTGSTRSRVGYAISRAVVRKGDNGRWQPDYSRVFGHLASGAMSNLYYPEEDRHGIGLTLTNTAIGLGGAAIGNLMQEFLYARFTTHARRPRDSRD
ncbi:MAG TPA: hypothetical protein VLV86_24770 [Vicinamibacterales bacterium]|nr:hypothetical protein [Vicinamibacterales bacterium]